MRTTDASERTLETYGEAARKYLDFARREGLPLRSGEGSGPDSGRAAGGGGLPRVAPAANGPWPPGPGRFTRINSSALWAVFCDLGYGVTDNSSMGADGGVDLVLSAGDSLSLVQCKRWATPVGARTLRELWAVKSALGVAGAIVVATRGYTTDARQFATSVGVGLIDGHEFLRLSRKAPKVKARAEAEAAG